MEIVLANPTKLAVTYEEGDSKENSGILSFDCLTVNFLPVFDEDTDKRNEAVFLVDRSEEKQKLAGTVTLEFEVNGRKYTNSANIVEAERPYRDVSAPSSLIFHRQAAKIQIHELSDRHATLVEANKDVEEAERIKKTFFILLTTTNVIS
ncbi:unnamed protein product [Schistocephalus solidus]|uniref:VIT domain-containing protein n=1 Tax=Schistocephalus solidus TaxID=70667 RepID=A0A183SAV0_SCHSO|nr:unnamed protein product [Schistocephalus solidus]